MPYDEQSFLEGLAAGLAATAGRQLGKTYKTLMTGTSRINAQRVFDGEYDTFLSRIVLRTSFPVKILYEYGSADAESPTREVRKIRASAEAQTVYHVIRLPATVPYFDFRYNAYILERAGMGISFDARCMCYPYESGSRLYEYPGSPEQVTVFWTRSIR